MEKLRTIHFLLEYSYAEGRLVSQQEFTDGDAAIAAYNAAEEAARHAGTVDKSEIVLIGADSLETVKATHGNYFSSSDRIPFSDLLTDDRAA